MPPRLRIDRPGMLVDRRSEGLRMKPKTIYLALCVAGTLLPYSQFVPFLREHGLDLRPFVEQLFSRS
jgi:Terpene cyclase DEP1